MVKQEFSGEAFSKIEKQNGEISGMIFEDCEFENCKFQDLTIKKCLFSGCLFKHCTLVGLTYKDTQALGNSFEECSISGTDWSALLDERKRAMNFLPFDTLANCYLRHCVFFGLDLRKFNFSESDLSGSYFDDCNLVESDFGNCELQGTSFLHNNISGANFKGAVNYSFSLESNKAAKAKFSLPEAMNLLSALGIILE